jgi:hypothetical protein
MHEEIRVTMGVVRESIRSGQTNLAQQRGEEVQSRNENTRRPEERVEDTLGAMAYRFRTSFCSRFRRSLRSLRRLSFADQRFQLRGDFFLAELAELLLEESVDLGAEVSGGALAGQALEEGSADAAVKEQ